MSAITAVVNDDPGSASGPIAPTVTATINATPAGCGLANHLFSPSTPIAIVRDGFESVGYDGAQNSSTKDSLRRTVGARRIVCPT